MNVFLMLLAIFIPSITCAEQEYGGMPVDFEQGDYSRYDSIESLIEAFRSSGAKINLLSDGNVVDIAYKPKKRNIQGPLGMWQEIEGICANTLKVKPKSGMFRNLRDGDWAYISSNGGPRVSFMAQVESAFDLVKMSQDSSWDGAWGGLLGVSLCNSYVDFPGQTRFHRLLDPKYVSFERCEYTKKNWLGQVSIAACHWIILRSPYLLPAVQRVLANADSLN